MFGFLFGFVTLALGFVLVVYALEILPSLPAARFLKVCLVPVFLLGAANRCIETWEILEAHMALSDSDALVFVSRTLQLLLLTYGMLRYFREGPSGYRGEERRRLPGWDDP